MGVTGYSPWDAPTMWKSTCILYKKDLNIKTLMPGSLLRADDVEVNLHLIEKGFNSKTLME